MTPETRDLMLRYLRKIDDTLDRATEEVQEIKRLLSSIEAHTAAIRSARERPAR
jgi:hypothetical protein